METAQESLQDRIDATLQEALQKPHWIEACQTLLQDGSIKDLMTRTGSNVKVDATDVIIVSYSLRNQTPQGIVDVLKIRKGRLDSGDRAREKDLDLLIACFEKIAERFSDS